ncbi:HNH endonuclease [Vibrio chagasii]|uniref:HNH endonuclease n=1 Tax=Vibrio chagasii TaxID=170679 RepID=UPI003552A479
MEKINYCNPKNSMNPNNIEFINEVKGNIYLVESNNWTGMNRKKLNFSFSGYDNGKDLIRPLAKGSCAYCGAKINQHTLVVEHYRPKNRLKARDNEFLLTGGEFLPSNKSRIVSDYGYFIWGSDYRNLLPACRPCNTGEGNNEGVYINNSLNFSIKYGKDDYFPILHKKNKRDNIYVRTIKNEYPLLFNPYKDNPNELFSYKTPSNFISKNEAIEIRPNKRTSKNKRLKAEASINILGLNRQSLCRKRWEICDSARHVMYNLAMDLESNTVTLSKCIRYAKVLCELNCETNGTMHGFTKTHTKKPVKFLYNVIRKNFPTESSTVFTNTDSFKEKVNELKMFKAQNDIPRDHQTTLKLNNIIESHL